MSLQDEKRIQGLMQTLGIKMDAARALDKELIDKLGDILQQVEQFESKHSDKAAGMLMQYLITNLIAGAALAIGDKK